MRLAWATQHVPGWLGFMVRHPVSTNKQGKELKEKRRKEKKKGGESSKQKWNVGGRNQPQTK